jgi:hypothetical protein
MTTFSVKAFVVEGGLVRYDVRPLGLVPTLSASRAPAFAALRDGAGLESQQANLVLEAAAAVPGRLLVVG